MDCDKQDADGFVFVDYPFGDACDFESETQFFEEKHLKIRVESPRYGALEDSMESLLFHRKFNYKAMMEMLFQSNKVSIFPCVFFDAEKYEKETKFLRISHNKLHENEML